MAKHTCYTQVLWIGILFCAVVTTLGNPGKESSTFSNMVYDYNKDLTLEMIFVSSSVFISATVVFLTLQFFREYFSCTGK